MRIMTHGLQCPIDHPSHDLRATMNTACPLDEGDLERIFGRLPRGELERCKDKHLFLGGVPEWNRTPEFDKELRIGRRVVVEVFWYYQVRNIIIAISAQLISRSRLTRPPSPCQ